VDLDNSGYIDEKEIQRALHMWNLDVDDESIQRLIQASDKDGNGQVSYDEFVDALARDTVALAAMGKRGLQSKEAMGECAFEQLNEQLGHGNKLKHAYAPTTAAATDRSMTQGELKKLATDAVAARFTDIKKAFRHFDVDNSGHVDEKEIKRGLDLFNIPIDLESIQRLIKESDKDGNGKISYEEFVDALARDTVAPAAMGKRGMQSKDAMGVDAYHSLDHQLGHGTKPKHAYGST